MAKSFAHFVMPQGFDDLHIPRSRALIAGNRCATFCSVAVFFLKNALLVTLGGSNLEL